MLVPQTSINNNKNDQNVQNWNWVKTTCANKNLTPVLNARCTL